MILWLTPPKGVHPKAKELLTRTLKAHGVSPSQILFYSVHHKVPGLSDHSKRTMPDPVSINAALSNLRGVVRQFKPMVIVINDEDTLRVITGQKYTLATTRGSKYILENVPGIVLDNLNNLRFVNSAKFILQFDLAKIIRHYRGESKQEPKFNFCCVRSVEELSNHVLAAKSSDFITLDTETALGLITVESFTYNTPQGHLITCCVPFFDPRQDDGAYWRSFEDEKKARLLMAEMHRNPVVKGLQNGGYDCAYYIREQTPIINYFVDTQVLMHSIWIEAPKKLHQIASYFCDCYTYWKDDRKGFEEDGWDRSSGATEKYYRYNGLDTYYTWLGAYYLLDIYKNTPYAATNYNSTFRLSVGPCLAASLRGLRVDYGRHAYIMSLRMKEALEGEADLRRLTNEPDFNVRSPNDVAWFLYDVCGAKKTRIQRKGSKYNPRSTDEKVLALIKEQRNPLVNNFIKRLDRAKEPATLLSNFGNYKKLCWKNGRLLSWHNAAGTDTYRFATSCCQFWTGRNTQNFQPLVKEFCVADDGYFFVELDWSSSDDYFIAHHAEDPDKIALLASGKDPHSWHASVFFSKDYNEILEGKRAKARWVIHAVEGVRQSSKKIVHGKNFGMGAEMMYNLMGRDAVVATARMLGYENAGNLSDKELIGICQSLMDKYDHPRYGMYRRIRPWQREIVDDAIANKNCAVNAYGNTRKFFGDLSQDADKQRQIASYYGQSGTAGNANRSLNKIFYSGIDDGQKVIFLLQCHDSFVFLVHFSALDRIKRIKAIMEEPVTVNGRTFSVPVNPKCGITWSEDMMDWKENMTYQSVLRFEKEHFEEKFPKHGHDVLETFATLNFDANFMSNIEEELRSLGTQSEDDQFGGAEDTDLEMETENA